MARPREAPSTHTRIPEFVVPELDDLVNILRGRAQQRATGPRVLGALVLAARQLPPDVVEALLPAYDDRASEFIGEAEDS